MDYQFRMNYHIHVVMYKLYNTEPLYNADVPIQILKVLNKLIYLKPLGNKW